MIIEQSWNSLYLLLYDDTIVGMFESDGASGRHDENEGARATTLTATGGVDWRNVEG